MGSPARRLTNPITRCWDQPHYGYAGTDDRRGTDPKPLDAKRLTLMRGRSGTARAQRVAPCAVTLRSPFTEVVQALPFHVCVHDLRHAHPVWVVSGGAAAAAGHTAAELQCRSTSRVTAKAALGRAAVSGAATQLSVRRGVRQSHPVPALLSTKPLDVRSGSGRERLESRPSSRLDRWIIAAVSALHAVRTTFGVGQRETRSCRRRSSTRCPTAGRYGYSTRCLST